MSTRWWWIGATIVAGCAGAPDDSIRGHEAAVVSAASSADVDDLGIDEDGCAAPAASGGYGVPVSGRPDLVGVVLDGAVVCVTTTEFASGSGLQQGAWWQDLRTQAVPMSSNVEPEPDPYAAGDDDAEGSSEEPEPDPYDGDHGKSGGSSSSTRDSQ